ncbi:GAF domain-containing protein [Streptomyces sp. NPDC051572]|uniref:GAF domain-containing protein n=1 Tax=Streptomyces sp. NPDC051572 TaxID=3155802 RepID=UPI00344B62C9
MHQPEGPQVSREASIRAARLHALGFLGPMADEVLEKYAAAAANLAAAPIARVNLVDDQRQMFCGLYIAPSLSRGSGSEHEDMSRRREMPLSQGYCMYVVDHASPLVLNDVSQAPHEADNSIMDRGIRAYLGVPLIDGLNTVLGTVCVMDFEPREWQERHLAELMGISRILMVEIGSREQKISERARLFETFDESSHPVFITRAGRLHITYSNPAFRALFGEKGPSDSGAQIFRDAGILDQLKGVHTSADTDRHDGIQMAAQACGGEFIFVARRIPGRSPNEVIAAGVEAERIGEVGAHLYELVSQTAEMLY